MSTRFYTIWHVHNEKGRPVAPIPSSTRRYVIGQQISPPIADPEVVVPQRQITTLARHAPLHHRHLRVVLLGIHTWSYHCDPMSVTGPHAQPNWSAIQGFFHPRTRTGNQSHIFARSCVRYSNFWMCFVVLSIDQFRQSRLSRSVSCLMATATKIVKSTKFDVGKCISPCGHFHDTNICWIPVIRLSSESANFQPSPERWKLYLVIVLVHTCARVCSFE